MVSSPGNVECVQGSFLSLGVVFPVHLVCEGSATTYGYLLLYAMPRMLK